MDEQQIARKKEKEKKDREWKCDEEREQKLPPVFPAYWLFFKNRNTRQAWNLFSLSLSLPLSLFSLCLSSLSQPSLLNSHR